MLGELLHLDRRLWLPYGVGMVGANVIGAGIIFVFLRFVLPLPDVEDADHVARTNLLLFAGYLAVAVPVGVVWVLRLSEPVLRWLREGGAPDAHEQRLILLTPARELLVHVTLWALGGVGFTLYNLHYSHDLALVVAIAVVLGACGSCAFAYLLGQRILRPVAGRALADAVPENPALPGLTVRLMLTWALGTGVPVLGLVLSGAGVLSGRLDASADRMAASAVFLGGVALLVGLLAMVLSARSIADPLAALRQALRRVQRGDTDVRVTVNDGSELGLLQAGFNQMVAGLAERERLRDLFGRQVGADVAQQALERGIRLGGEERDVAALFVDLVGSTEMAHDRPPTEVVELLNAFFDVVVDVVDAERGTVNKFVGDAALCIFGAPLDHPDAPGAALRAARGILAGLTERVPSCDVGIGVSCGRVVAGNIGAAQRFEYTVIGDPVNEASRLTELAKAHPERILASGAAVRAADEDEARHWRLDGRERLRGRAAETELALPVDGPQRPSAASGAPQASSDAGGGTL